jgi:flagellar hook-associated protein 1
MGSTFAGLNTMVRGLNANQLSLSTVGHNITNATTTGYSRQSVNLVATPSETTPTIYGDAQLGTGVDASSITRARDIYADKQFWSENSNQEYYNTRQTNYTKVEAIYSDTDSTGLQSKLSAFWKSLQTLGTTGGGDSYTNRVSVYDSGNEAAQSINTYATELQSQIKSEYDDMNLKVSKVNEITSEILNLNKSILQTEATGGTANDLRDQRDSQVDELSKYVKTNVQVNSNGSYSIVSNGNTLVDDTNRLELETTPVANAAYGVTDYTIQIKATGTTYEPGNGSLQGLQDSIAENKDAMDDLSKMAAFFLTTFNDQHKAGYGIDSATTTGTNFFGTSGTVYTWDTANSQVKAGTTALNTIDTIKALAVNTDLSTAAGKNLIAARGKLADGVTTEGTAGTGNAVLLSNLFSKASSTATSLGTVSLNDYYTGLTSSLGSKSNALDARVTQQTEVMATITNSRQSTSGVNWDEELTNMLKFQQGYSASSRCLTTMDSMLDKLINSTGMVGR